MHPAGRCPHLPPGVPRRPVAVVMAADAVPDAGAVVAARVGVMPAVPADPVRPQPQRRENH
jgi:hypothetical protein